ncbi:hypothetical protein [Nonomuraea dietziae]|uniref:hypothetical protein n=1 Tax=Nonomuraea dietziae TaxID=65515 RepID=UPI0031CE2780
MAVLFSSAELKEVTDARKPTMVGVFCVDPRTPSSKASSPSCPKTTGKRTTEVLMETRFGEREGGPDATPARPVVILRATGGERAIFTPGVFSIQVREAATTLSTGGMREHYCDFGATHT